METNRRSVAEEAAARTREAMERARSGQKEIRDRAPQMALPEHPTKSRSLAREHPLEAALGALSLGFLVTRFLPIRALVGALFRLTRILFKPALLLYAGVKLAQFFRESQQKEEGQIKP